MLTFIGARAPHTSSQMESQDRTWSPLEIWSGLQGVVWGGPGDVSHSGDSTTSPSECGRGTGPHFHQNNSLVASFGIAPHSAPATPPPRHPAHVKINNTLILDSAISILDTGPLMYHADESTRLS